MGTTWPSRLQYIGCFVICMGLYLMWARGPAANSAQQLFRVGTIAAGVVVWCIGFGIQMSRRRDR